MDCLNNGGEHCDLNAQIYNYSVTSSAINCAKNSITSLVTVDIALLRCFRSTSIGTVHTQVGSILILALTTTQ